MSKTTDARTAANVPERITLAVLQEGYAWTTPHGCSAFVEYDRKALTWEWEIALPVSTDRDALRGIAQGKTQFLHQALRRIVRRDSASHQLRADLTFSATVRSSMLADQQLGAAHRVGGEVARLSRLANTSTRASLARAAVF